MGLFIRYGIIAALTFYLAIGGKANFGWFQQYASILRKRQIKKIMMTVWLSIGMVGIYVLLTLAFWWFMNILSIPFINSFVHTRYCSYRFLKTIFIAQLSYYLFMHTRTTLYYYPWLSCLLCLQILIPIQFYPYFLTQYLLNLHLLLQILLTLIMLLIQQYLINIPYYSQYKPSISKPRMLYYIGYQLSWQKSIPPLWTYFTNWFDWSYSSQKQRVLIQGDYQLLYGMMLGLNQRQQLPQQQQSQDQSQLLQMKRQIDPQN